jgi:membrane associated rhomboid family serine protease
MVARALASAAPERQREEDDHGDRHAGACRHRPRVYGAGRLCYGRRVHYAARREYDNDAPLMFIPLYDDNPDDPLFYPFVTRSLVVANILVFVVFQSGLVYATAHLAALGFGFIPATLLDEVEATVPAAPPAFTILTYMFLHGGWMHLLGNMLFLWIFGDNVEHAMGRVRFLVFYLACGVAGGLAHFLSAPTSTVPLVGASAAIAGIVVAYLLLFPHAKVWVLVLMRIPLRLAAKWVLGTWVAFQFLNAIVAAGDRIAWWHDLTSGYAGRKLIED